MTATVRPHPALGAIEVAFIGVVVAVGTNEVGIDRASAAVAQHQSRIVPEGPGCDRLAKFDELDEVGVGYVVVGGRGDDVVLNQLPMIANRAAHGFKTFPFSVHRRGGPRRKCQRPMGRDDVPRGNRSEAAARTALTRSGSARSWKR